MRFVLAAYEVFDERPGGGDQGYGLLFRIMGLAGHQDVAQRKSRRADRLIVHLQRELPLTSDASYSGGRFRIIPIEGIPEAEIPIDVKTLASDA